jgi:hypothetical protein
MEVSKDRANKVVEYTKENYSIVKFLQDRNLWDDSGTMKCPFHYETNPSFRVNVLGNVYHCFSCESRGSYMSLYHDYKVKVEEDNKSFYHHVEEVLSSDETMQHILGFNSVYKNTEESLSLDSVINRVYKLYRPKETQVKTYESLFRKLKTLDEKLKLFALIQKQYSVEYCWKVLIDGASTIEEAVNDIQTDDSITTEFENILNINSNDLTDYFK